MDNISLQRLEKLHPKYKYIFKNFYNELYQLYITRGITVRVTQGLRTFEEQQKLYNQGRTTKGIKVTNAPAGYSYHNYGLAIDIIGIDKSNKLVDLNWQEVDKVADKYNLIRGSKIAGFPAGDNGHFQPKNLPKTSKLLADYNSNKLDTQGYLTTV